MGAPVFQRFQLADSTSAGIELKVFKWLTGQLSPQKLCPAAIATRATM